MQRMLGMRGLPPANLRGLELQGLSIEVRAEVLAAFEQMRQRIEQHEIEAAEREAALAERTALLQRKDRDLALRDAKIEKLEFEIARYKRWKFAAKTEAMSAEQRRLFEETVVEDEAGLQAPLVVLATAHHEHALAAFEVHALDDLLKPVDDERLAQALARRGPAAATPAGPAGPAGRGSERLCA